MSLSKSILCGEINELRELVDLNDKLKQLTKNDTALMNFASIVLLGEQSHGKTSTIENLTNLNLPSGGGMQTRLPLEIRVRRRRRRRREDSRWNRIARTAAISRLAEEAIQCRCDGL